MPKGKYYCPQEAMWKTLSEIKECGLFTAKSNCYLESQPRENHQMCHAYSQYLESGDWVDNLDASIHSKALRELLATRGASMGGALELGE